MSTLLTRERGKWTAADHQATPPHWTRPVHQCWRAEIVTVYALAVLQYHTGHYLTLFVINYVITVKSPENALGPNLKDLHGAMEFNVPGKKTVTAIAAIAFKVFPFTARQ
ncbi:hypothetical protein ACOMHN_066407 [Nucella lapillus]